MTNESELAQEEFRESDESYEEALERIARAMIARALLEHEADVAAAAQDLQMEREDLEAEMDRLGMPRGGG